MLFLEPLTFHFQFETLEREVIALQIQPSFCSSLYFQVVAFSVTLYFTVSELILLLEMLHTLTHSASCSLTQKNTENRQRKGEEEVADYLCDLAMLGTCRQPKTYINRLSGVDLKS